VVPRALELCAQLAEGLEAMHRSGLLHLDLKPANVALARLRDGTEQAVLLDPATAHLIAAGGLQPQTPPPLASAAYLAPDEAPDARADLYSLGVLLFELLSGRLPLPGATADDLARAHREQAPLRLCDAGRRVHPELEAVLARLLAKDPAQRFASGDELAVILRALLPIAEEASALATTEEPAPAASAETAEPAGPQSAQSAGSPKTASQLPSPVESALERALLGEVPEEASVEPARQRPAWVARVAVAAAVALIAVAALLARSGMRHEKRTEAAPAAGERAHRAAPDEMRQPAPAAPASAAPAPAPASAAISAAPPAETAPAAKPPRSPFARELERAQKQLWTGRAEGAEATLRPLLARSALPPRDRARASRMMGDAEAKKGNKAAAAGWYRKALQLSTEPAERDRLEQLIQAQRK
jgi:serine/threonine-protein kinase